MRTVLRKSAEPGKLGSPVDVGAVSRKVLEAIDAAALDLPDGVRLTIELTGETVETHKASEQTESVLRKQLPIFKTAEERVVIGIVLEPTKELNKPDSQNDVYSADEVRQACYRFMEDYQTIGLQHREDITGRATVLLNWITMEATTIGGQPVAAGTWLMGVRVEDDQIWQDVKSGNITGFSIGGYANRQPANA